MDTLQDRLQDELTEDNFKFKEMMTVVSPDGNRWHVSDYAMNHKYKAYLLVNGSNCRRCSTAWRAKDIVEEEFSRGDEAFERLGW